MKIYIPHSKELNFEEELYRPIKESGLNSEHEFFLPHEDGMAKDFTTKDIIRNCDIMIAEVSLPGNYGLGIEIGWADAFGIKIVCIHKIGSKISGSLKFVCDNFIEYTDKDDMIEKLKEIIRG